MKPCPYRKEHEWDEASGLCRHCYSPRPAACDKHRFKFNGMTVNPVGTTCVWCGKPLQQALDENGGVRA